MCSCSIIALVALDFANLDHPGAWALSWTSVQAREGVWCLEDEEKKQSLESNRRKGRRKDRRRSALVTFVIPVEGKGEIREIGIDGKKLCDEFAFSTYFSRVRQSFKFATNDLVDRVT